MALWRWGGDLEEHVQGNPGLFLKGFVGVTATRLHIRWLSWDLVFSAQGAVEAHLEHRTLGPKSHVYFPVENTDV